MIEIPGYRVVRQIGRGGMATVYLAIQRSVDREVALKVMSPQLLADPNYGERFLREARIAAKLHHRHVVGVHDVGHFRDLHFIAMEYLPGGAISTHDGGAREGGAHDSGAHDGGAHDGGAHHGGAHDGGARGEAPRGVAFALRVTREIATALSYAHAKGFVHRDVKPDNILLREDGSAALADFGIARANESVTRMTRTGAVVGTPHYMSPEQARGRPIDGRADLYSLGIVLHELIVGRVPYQAEDSLAVGIMHISDPVPQLPPPYEALQPLLARLLAKEPGDRYQDGDEVALAIQDLERAHAAGELAGLPAPRDDVRRRMLETRLLPRATPPLAATTQASPVVVPDEAYARGEPRIGRIDDALLREDRPRAAPARTRRERGVLRTIFTLLALTAIVVALWSNQERLRALLPETQVNTLLIEGDAALARRQLIGADSASARYAQVLELDPDNTRALEGRERIGEQLLSDARRALEAGRTDEARALALEARALLGGGDRLATLDQDIESAAARTNTLDALLAKAREAQAAGTLAGDADGALALYKQALIADPDNAIAASGLQSVLDALAAQAHAALRQDDVVRGAATIERVARASPSHPGLPELRAALGDAERRAKQRRTDERRRGEGLLLQASAALDANDPEAAARLIEAAQSTGVAATELAEARNRLAELEERHAIAASADPSDAQQQRADALVDAAEAALASGNLMDPPGANAYDKYREALGADPRHARALAGMGALPDRARLLFADALEQRLLGQARQYLDVVEAVRRDDPDLPRLRRELAIALLAQAERHIADGQLDVAARSIAKARELAPGEPRIADTENRLRLARGS